MREYLVLEYAPSKRNGPRDRLFVPTDQLDLITLDQHGDGQVGAGHRLPVALDDHPLAAEPQRDQQIVDRRPLGELDRVAVGENPHGAALAAAFIAFLCSRTAASASGPSMSATE